METWEALTSRRNVRAYQDESLPREQLDRILEAGRRAPSANNWQPWDFVLVTDQETLRELSKVWQGAGHVAGSAATIVLVAQIEEDAGRRDRLRFDLGQATMAMMLAAADLGIGSGHANVSDQERTRELLGIPDDRFAAVMIALGRPADRPLRPIGRPDRRAFDDVVHAGRW
ncbi:nitroreductase family protein [Spirillospora sp. CA-128828]|uniref:nitroreductase family protein n=1 Tax=Spirillospora sp. CA-128828 TaxID=3240033 RepID=UPI003D89D505